MPHLEPTQGSPALPASRWTVAALEPLRCATQRCPPYMHDGRFQTLEEVLEHYNSGGQPSQTIDPFMKYASGGLMLQAQQKEALIAFLHTLTDTAFASNPAFADPH